MTSVNQGGVVGPVRPQRSVVGLQDRVVGPVRPQRSVVGLQDRVVGPVRPQRSVVGLQDRVVGPVRPQRSVVGCCHQGPAVVCQYGLRYRFRYPLLMTGKAVKEN